MKFNAVLAVLGFGLLHVAAGAATFSVRVVDAENPHRTIAESLVEPTSADGLGLVAVTDMLSIDGTIALDPKSAQPQTVELAEGEHRIEPGGIAFRVSGGSFQSQDPSIAAERDQVTLRLHPVGIYGKDRLTGGHTRVFPRVRWNGKELFSPQPTWRNARPIVLFLPAGSGYELSCGPVPFSVNAHGVQYASEVPGARLRTPFDIELDTIPLWIRTRSGADKRVAVQVNDSAAATTFHIFTDSRRGMSEGEKDWAIHVPTSSANGTWLVDAQHALPEARWSLEQSGGALHDQVTLDLAEFPFQALLYHGSDETTRQFRFLGVAVDDVHVDVGQEINVRVRFNDASDSPWATPKVEWQAILESMRELGGLHVSPETHPLALVAAEGDGRYKVTIPPVPAGRYRFVVAATDPATGKPSASLMRDLPMAVENPNSVIGSGVSASLFTDHGRSVFLAGEAIEINIGAGNPTEQPVTLPLRVMLESGRSKTVWPVKEIQLSLDPRSRRTTGLVLSDGFTRQLSDDTKYRVRLIAEGERMLDELEFEIARPDRATHATVLREDDADLIYIQDRVQATLPYDRSTRLGIADEIAHASASIGFNLHGFGHPFEVYPETEAMLIDHHRDRSRTGIFNVDFYLPGTVSLPAAEATRKPAAMSLIAEELLRHGVGLSTTSRQGDNHAVPLREEPWVALNKRVIQLHAQGMRRFPNYVGGKNEGWCHLAYENQVETTSGHDPRPDEYDAAAVRQALWEQFQKEQRFTGPIPTLWPCFFGAPTGSPVIDSSAHPDRWVEWVRFNQPLLPSVFADWRTSTDPFCPQLVQTAFRRNPSWSGTHSAYEACFVGHAHAYDAGTGDGGLDVLSLTQSRMDAGSQPYSDGLWCDLYATRADHGQPLWAISRWWGWYGICAAKSAMEKFVTLAASRGGTPGYSSDHRTAPQAVTDTSDAWDHQSWGLRQNMKRTVRFLRTYGDLFASLERPRQVALLASKRQSALAFRSYGQSLFQAYAALQLAHVPATFVYEEDLLARGKLDGYQALFVVAQFEPLPAPMMGEIARFRRGGGQVFVDASSNVEVPGAQRIDVSFPEWHEYNNTRWAIEAGGIDWIEYCHADWRRLHSFVEPKLPALREAFASHVKQFVACDNPYVLLSQRSSGRGDYAFAANYTPMAEFDWVSTMPRPLYNLSSYWNQPVRQQVQIDAPRDYAVYDLLSQRDITEELRASGGKWTIDFEDFGGRVFAFLPEPARQIRLDLDKSPRLGQPLAVRTFVLGGRTGQPIDAQVPVEIRLTDPAGQPQALLYRSAGRDGHAEEIDLPVDAPPGKWTIHVRQLLDGRGVKHVFDLASPASGSESDIASTVPDIIATNATATASFVRERKQIVIPLDRGQERLKPILEPLVSALKQRGADVQLTDCRTLPTGAHRRWVWTSQHQTFGAQPPVEQIDADVILVGSPLENRLIESLRETGVLLRDVTPNYPGQGRALIEHVWSAYFGARDAVLVLGNDDVSVAKGVGALVAMLERDPSAEWVYDPAPNLEQARLQTLPRDFLRYQEKLHRVSLLPAPPGDERLRTVPAEQLIETTEVDPLILPDEGEAVYTVAFSSDGARLVAGSDSLHENLFDIDVQEGKIVNSHGANGNHWTHQLAAETDGSVVVTYAMPGVLRVMDGLSGDVRWEQKLQVDRVRRQQRRPEADHFVHAQIAPHGAVVLVNQDPQTIACRRLTDGKVLWRMNYASDDAAIDSQAMRMSLSADGRLLAVSVGRMLRSMDEFTTYAGIPRLAEPEIQKMLPKLKTEILLIETDRGQVRWRKSFGFGLLQRAEYVRRLDPTLMCEIGLKSFDERACYDLVGQMGASLCITPDGSRVIAGSEIGDLLILNSGSGERARWMSSESHGFHGPLYLRLSPDGRKLAAYPWQGKWHQYAFPESYATRRGMMMIDVESFRVESILDSDEAVSDAIFWPDSSGLAVGRWDNTVTLYDLSLKAHAIARVDGGTRLASSLDGTRLAAGTSHGSVELIDRSGKVVWSVRTNQSPGR